MSLMKSLVFTVDLSGSKNLGINPEEFVKEILIEPFKKTEVARFELKKSWKLKTKFKYVLSSPSQEI